MHERIKTPKVEERPDTENKTRPIFSILKLPYVGDMSHQIEKKFGNFYSKNFPKNQNLLWYMKQQVSNYWQKFRYKDRQTLLHSSGVVHKLYCSCGQSYIGQIKRKLKIRINDHMPKNSTNNETDVSQHLKNNPDHTMNFHSPEIVAHSNNIRKLRIKETLLIQNLQPQLNIDDSSNPIYLFNILLSSHYIRVGLNRNQQRVYFPFIFNVSFLSYDLINPTIFVLNNPTANLNCLICPFNYILCKSQLLCL